MKANGQLTKILGTNVRRRRLEMGLTQEELAAAIGVHAPYISDVERGKRGPALGKVAQLADILATTPGALLEKKKG